MTAREIPGSERLIVVVGPSSAGKDSVISAWLDTVPAAQRPRRARRTITRAFDPNEDHEPLQAEAFLAEAAAGAFAFHWQAHGLHYGIRHAQLAPLHAGAWVVMNGSRAHLPLLRRHAPSAQVVEIHAPPQVLQARLHTRGREPSATRQQRLARQVEQEAGAALRIENTGTLAEAVGRIDGWWRGLG